jgi:hypothetical protein
MYQLLKSTILVTIPQKKALKKKEEKRKVKRNSA